MSITELNTFVRKFQQLWKDGFTAHLDMDTQVGNVWVCLRLNLARVPGPIHGNTPPRQHVPPSRLRRGARREAARSSKLVSSELVEQRSHDHLCKVKLTFPCGKIKDFVRPLLRGYPDFFKNVKML